MTNILRYDMNRFVMVVAAFTILSLVGMLGAALLTPYANAALTDTADFSQVISDGAIAVEVRNASRVAVGSPVYSMTAVTFDFDCQTSTGNGVLGDNAQRIYIDDGIAGGGWTLAISATGAATDQWENGGATETYDYNDDGTMPTCAEGADTDVLVGRLTVDPTVGNGALWTADFTNGDLTGISYGASQSFQEVATAVPSIELGASDASQGTGRWYFTAGDLSQTIPGNQPADTYTIGMTITGAAA